MQKLQYIRRIVQNKYFLATVSFLVWMAFFDPKDWGLMDSRRLKLNELELSERTMVLRIKDAKKELALLKTSAQTIEKYARENYYMKKDNEDLFLVKTP